MTVSSGYMKLWGGNNSCQRKKKVAKRRRSMPFMIFCRPHNSAALPRWAAMPVLHRSGHWLNSILLTFRNQGSVLKSTFSATPQSRFVSAVHDSVVLEATHEASQGPLKGAVSAQKALQESEMETRELLGGTEEKSISLIRDHFLQKRKLKKLS